MSTAVARRVEGHQIRWFVWGWNSEGDRAKIPHESNMRGTWGYDAECSCGWKSRTGGATRGSVQRDVRNHKYDATGDWRQL